MTPANSNDYDVRNRKLEDSHDAPAYAEDQNLYPIDSSIARGPRWLRSVRDRFQWGIGWECFIAFLLVTALEIFVGFDIWYFHPTDMTPYPSDAFSRTANAYFVLYYEPHRLASIGAVWNPLPSLLQLPILLFARFWQPLASYGLSGVILSSVFAGGTAALLVHAFRSYAKLGRVPSILLVAAYSFNPYIFYYGYNGMSESLSFFFVILTIYLIMWWMKTGKPFYISASGWAMFFLFLTRYEAIPFSVGVWLVVFAYIWRSKRESIYVLGNRWEKLHYVEATSFILVMPLLFGIAAWILYNAVIMGDPFYFLNSAYSNSTQVQFVQQTATFAETVFDLFRKTAPFIVVYIFILLLRLFSGRIFTVGTLCISLLVVCIWGFHAFLLLRGGTYGWMRFFSYPLPISTIWLAYEIYVARRTVRKAAVWGGFAALLITCAVAQALHLTMEDSDDWQSVEDYQEIAFYLKENINPDKVLMDSFATSGILLQIQDFEGIIITCDPDFDSYLEDPIRMEVGYVLIPQASGVVSLDAVVSAYPQLNGDESVEGFDLVKEFDGITTYYLYKIDYDSGVNAKWRSETTD